jgi:hypothetical protein
MVAGVLDFWEYVGHKQSRHLSSLAEKSGKYGTNCVEQQKQKDF